LFCRFGVQPMIPRPHSDEYTSFYAGYVELVPEGSDIFAILSAQPDELRALMQGLSDAQAEAHPAPGEWSIKEVLGHICDAERVFAYRTLRGVRGDATPLAGFDQDEYVRATNFNARSLDSLLDEFASQRRSSLLCFHPLSDTEFARRGTVNDN